jgi:two-component sensor histidine kinase
LLENSLADQTVVEGFLVEQEFPRIGRRIFLLHARKVLDTKVGQSLILLGFEDISERRAIERDKEVLKKQTDDLLLQKEMLLAEMQHRIVNSLQIIASILMLKARAVASEETREHLKDAHRRVMSVAAVQQHLHSSGRADVIDVAPYLEKLCGSLGDSMIGENRAASIAVKSDAGVLPSAEAVSLGLIVTELVINALKYAFPDAGKPGVVAVHYDVDGADWKLTVSDNGVGRTEGGGRKGGLGTSLVAALADQLDAEVSSISGAHGLNITVTHIAAVTKSAA